MPKVAIFCNSDSVAGDRMELKTLCNWATPVVNSSCRRLRLTRPGSGAALGGFPKMGTGVEPLIELHTGNVLSSEENSAPTVRRMAATRSLRAGGAFVPRNVWHTLYLAVMAATVSAISAPALFDSSFQSSLFRKSV